MRVECVGKAPLYVNGVLVERATLVEGDVLTVGKALVLLFTHRAPSMPRRAVAASTLRAFGEPDAFGILGESSAVWILREQLAFAAKSSAKGETSHAHRRSARGMAFKVAVRDRLRSRRSSASAPES